MMEGLWAFLIFWSVWILIPILVDGVDSLYRIILVLAKGRKREEFKVSEEDLPNVSVIIPARNEAKVIDRCLNSLKIQDYPHDKLEVIVVDDGSTDGTSSIVNGHINGNDRNNKNGYINGNGVRINGKFIPIGDFGGVIKLLVKKGEGKAAALNAGISLAHGEIIINIDSDVVLVPNAIRKMAEAFLKDKTLGAATGNIEINWEIIEERDRHGNLVLDRNGEIKLKKLTSMEMFLAKCQFLEYLNAFRLGRQAQDITKSMFTLAGAFSAFRRYVLLKSSLYQAKTVSEDADLTLDIHRQKVRIGYVAEAKAYLEPVTDWDKLYAQRIRWDRGKMEVCGLHGDIVGNLKFGNLGWLGLPKMLLIDHTMAFPRLIWTFLLPLFFLFGYSPIVIFYSLVAMYLFYMTIDFLTTAFAYYLVDNDTKKVIGSSFFYCFWLPLYRFILFYFRVSGYLVVFKDPPTWSVSGPINGFRNGLNNYKRRMGETTAFFLATLMVVFSLLAEGVRKSPFVVWDKLKGSFVMFMAIMVFLMDSKLAESYRRKVHVNLTVLKRRLAQATVFFISFWGGV